MPDVDAGGRPPDPTGADILCLRPPDPCVGLQHLFFGGDRFSIAAAKTVCAGCPRRVACLDEALAWPVTDVNGTGVWGGTTPAERRQLRQGRAA